MSYVLGIDEYLYANGATAGVVVGGSMTEESEPREIRTIGDWRPTQLREGLHRVFGNASLILQNKTLIEYAKRDANGRLTEMTFEGGYDTESKKHNNCKIDTLSLECVAGGELRANMSWKGRYSENGGGGAMSPSSDRVLMWFEGALAGIGGVELTGASININHNTDWVPVIDNTLTPKRSAKYIREGNQVVTANLRFLEQEGVDLSAVNLDYIASVTITFVGANTVTLTLTDLKRGVHERPLAPGELIEHGASYGVRDFNIS
jgi:hypothetical protein